MAITANRGSGPLSPLEVPWGDRGTGTGPGDLVLERFGDVDRQLRRVRESHHVSSGGSGFVQYCDSQSHAAQLQSDIHRERDRTARDAGVGGHGSTLRVHRGVMTKAQFPGFSVNRFTFGRETFRAGPTREKPAAPIRLAKLPDAVRLG